MLFDRPFFAKIMSFEKPPNGAKRAAKSGRRKVAGELELFSF